MSENFSKQEIEQLRYGIALITEEVCNKIHSVKNPANNMKILSEYKLKLQKLSALDDKIQGC